VDSDLPHEWVARLREALGRSPPEREPALVELMEEIHVAQRHIRERLDLLSSASFEGLFVHVGGVVIDVNQRLCEMHGYERDEMLGPHTLRRCIAEEDLPTIRKRMAEQFEGTYVATAIRKDGSRFLVEAETKPAHLGDQAVRVVAVRDVTERERVTRLLRESETRFRELVDAAFDLTVFSRDGVIVDVRGAVERVLGRGSAEVIGRPVYEFMAPTSVPVAREMIRESRRGFINITAKNASGELVPTQALVVASTLDGRTVRVAGVRDLRPALRAEAERAKLAQQVQQAQRLESLGILAGGIAHDFNNLLTGVLGNAGFVLENVTDPQVREATEAIIHAARGAAALTRQMLTYAGKRELADRAPLDLGDLLQELRSLLDATLSKKARILLDVEEGGVVLGERTTLSQVFMNLLTNASDALSGRPGDIRVRVRRERATDERWRAAQGAAVREGDWVLIEIEDSGVGMDEATRLRVFEPFFSTKEKGHGLGLAAVFGIVSDHGGAILVESEVGHGSRFSVLLPGTEAAPRRQLENVSAKPRTCRVLVVDDEEVVRAQLRRLLEGRGYAVIEASSGTGGLVAIQSKSPDVVILDVSMPDLDGPEVLLRMRDAGETVPVVLSSGFLEASLDRQAPGPAFQAFLPKPYGATEVVNAIERALSAGPARLELRG
jgi:two-component system, cell cycle sensor histidine kinase and response regulator CckA